ncbi:hypothetical protein L0668_14215 [Paraglaciecola aquimarina]|uniref:Uncharacterized protein n=1 Tax=Paraglaciecola algarum TaxID=3050085 RepID=A0ABS9DBV2_9ALTE|nr:hypothetical protein [Paraglaciecola sp. G1-23]MCF2949269.1 hypothetical protein [Paraglaciecola sp. G1-23]
MNTKTDKPDENFNYASERMFSKKNDSLRYADIEAATLIDGNEGLKISG